MELSNEQLRDRVLDQLFGGEEVEGVRGHRPKSYI